MEMISVRHSENLSILILADSCRPTMRQSAHPVNDATDKAQRAFKNKQFEIKFKSEFDDFCIRR
jgi:hypothetical protein